MERKSYTTRKIHIEFLGCCKKHLTSSIQQLMAASRQRYDLDWRERYLQSEGSIPSFLAASRYGSGKGLCLTTSCTNHVAFSFDPSSFDPSSSRQIASAHPATEGMKEMPIHSTTRARGKPCRDESKVSRVGISCRPTTHETIQLYDTRSPRCKICLDGC